MVDVKEIVYTELSKIFKLDGDKLFRLSYGKWKEVSLKCNTTQGYCLINWNSTTFRAHRIIYSLANKCDVPTDMSIDHENGIRDDNRIENLRLATSRFNNGNRVEHRNGKLLGVNWNRSRNNWQTLIRIGKKLVFLGSFDTEEESHEIYKKAQLLVEEYVDNKQFRDLLKNGL